VDAFAVSVSCGMSVSGFKRKDALWLCLYFGAFQAVMTLLGTFIGGHFSAYIGTLGRFAAFILLGAIGGQMIWSALRGSEGERSVPKLTHRRMVILAIAVSIDALAAGIGMTFLAVDILLAALIIGVVAALMSLLGSAFGEHVGSKFRQRAELAGGLVLIALGIWSLFG